MNPELLAYLNSLSAARPDAMPTPGGRPSAFEQMQGMAKAGGQAALALSPIGAAQDASQQFETGHPIAGLISAASMFPMARVGRVGTRLASEAVPFYKMANEAEAMVAKNQQMLSETRAMLARAGIQMPGLAVPAARPGRETFVNVLLKRLPSLP